MADAGDDFSSFILSHFDAAQQNAAAGVFSSCNGNGGGCENAASDKFICLNFMQMTKIIIIGTTRLAVTVNRVPATRSRLNAPAMVCHLTTARAGTGRICLVSIASGPAAVFFLTKIMVMPMAFIWLAKGLADPVGGPPNG
uniref:Uncharacterized protein n=1 Tax=Romanomermis culicivorax TaxID=13658 RepID=A0A915INA1_ROMCU